jgi:hypothetical protein
MNPDYPDIPNSPDVIEKSGGRKLIRGIKLVMIDIDGEPLTYAQPGWWESLDDDGGEAQFADEDNAYRAQVIENWRKFRREHPRR